MAATGEQVRSVTRHLHAASAVMLGVLGCVTVETLTARLLAHSHAAAHGTAAGVRYVHDHAIASALVVGCLLLVSVAAVAAAARRRATRSAIMWASGLSISSFVAVDLVSHGLSGAPHPASPLLLLAGGVVHVCVGAGVGLLWWRWLDGVRQPAVRARLDAQAGPRPAGPSQHRVGG